jgi:hypothetical protein
MRVCYLPLLVVVLLLPACGSNTPAPPPAVETGEALQELAEVYKYLVAQKVPPPRKPEDLAEYSGSLEGAMPLIRSGDIVVVWGAGYSSGSSQVLAYEKDAATSGGKVLLRNGTVKHMSADEFRAAKR